MSTENNTQTPAQVDRKAATMPSASERFTAAVEREFNGTAGAIQLTNFQRKLCQNYFIKIDQILKQAETKRLAKDERYRDPIPYTWENVNLNALAIDVIAFSAVGMDPTQPNHLNPIPYANKLTKKYDIAFIPGYKGTEIKARKYGLDVPDDVVVELVYANDNFKAIKRDANNPIETYVFEITKPFDRGEVVGGFYYHKFNDHPEKNRLKEFSKAQIDKRKPDHASVQFWGGEKDVWGKDQNGKNKVVGTETVEGWYEEMAYKTIYKAAYNAITIDSEKIDEHFMTVIQREQDNRDNVVLREIADNANRKEIGFDDEPPIQTPEVVTNEQPSQPVQGQPKAETEPTTETKTEKVTAQHGQQIKAPF